MANKNPQKGNRADFRNWRGVTWLCSRSGWGGVLVDSVGVAATTSKYIQSCRGVTIVPRACKALCKKSYQALNSFFF